MMTRQALFRFLMGVLLFVAVAATLNVFSPKTY